jgi:hypothetical protein
MQVKHKTYRTLCTSATSYQNSGYTLDTSMSNLLSVVLSTSIAAAVRPICGKGVAHADDGIMIMTQQTKGGGVILNAIAWNTDHSLRARWWGTHHCPRRSFRGKESARLIHLLSWLLIADGPVPWKV